MNLPELQREAHAIAVARGDWDAERTFGDLIADIHEALSEARKAERCYRDAKVTRSTYIRPQYASVMTEGTSRPVGVAFELADVVIRVADIAEHYGVSLSEEFVEVSDDLWVGSLSDRFESFGDWIGGCHLMASDALWGKWGPHTPDYAPTKWAKCFALLIDLVGRVAAHYGIDLDAAIAAKMAYYRARATDE